MGLLSGLSHLDTAAEDNAPQRMAGGRQVVAETVYGACPLDCPDACAWAVTVEDGVPVDLQGRRDHPFTRGGLCLKVNPYLQYAAGPDRLLHPMRRVGRKGEGRFERIGWDDALGELARRLRSAIREHGPESIWPFAGTGTMGFLQGWPGAGQRLWNLLGTSEHDAPTICSIAGHVGMRYTAGHACGMDPELLARSGSILLWGTNTAITNQHLWPFIKQARAAGAPLVVIDPVRTRTAARADVHLAVKPGTDAALAFGLIRQIVALNGHDAEFLATRCLGWAEFHAREIDRWSLQATSEETGVPAEEIASVAELIVKHRPVGVRSLMGMQRHAGGGQAARAISCIPAVTGDYNRVGGGAVYSTSPAYAFDLGALNARHLRTRPSRSLAMTRLAEGLLDLDDPPVAVLLVSGANPVVSNPDQNRVRRGLAREDLYTVVIEHRLTDTARYADLVLPSTVQTEHFDVHDSYTHLYVHCNLQATPRRGEALPHTEIFRRLARAMGLEEPALFASDEDLARALLNSGHPNLAGITLDRLRRDGYARLSLPDPYLPFAERFATPSGRFEFRSDTAEAAGHGLYPTYVPPRSRHAGEEGRLTLLATASRYRLNSTFGSREGHNEDPATVTLHPHDAARWGVGDGDLVDVWNGHGGFTAPVAIDPATRAGVALASKGHWANGGVSTVNAVTAEEDADMGRGATYHDSAVSIRRSVRGVGTGLARPEAGPEAGGPPMGVTS